MRKKQYQYKGNTYTLNELCELFPHVKPSVLTTRLNKGMTVAEAIRPQTYEELVPEQYRGKELIVYFDSTPPVLPKVQPALRTRYVATPHAAERHGKKVFYTVNVRGFNLIVYPGEFRILGVAKKCEEQECAPPYGEKVDCDFHQNGMCVGA